MTPIDKRKAELREFWFLRMPNKQFYMELDGPHETETTLNLVEYSAYQALEARHEKLLEALEFYANKGSWGEHGIDQRGWYIIESTDRGTKARKAIEADRKAGGK